MKMEYIFTKIDDDYYISEDAFKNFLCTNKHISFKTEEKGKVGKKIFLFDGHEFEYELEVGEVEESNEKLFHLNIVSQGEDDEQVEILNSVDSVIKEINKKCGVPFSINTIWNDVSLYYAKKLYPEISRIENELRKIIYLFMLKTVGSEWFNTHTPDIFQAYIKNVIEKNNKSLDEIEDNWLIYADFITLVKFFSVPYALESDVKTLFKELEQYINEEDLEEKAKNGVAKPLTVEALKELAKKYEPRNNWERYFLDNLKIKSSGKFSKDWSSLCAVRNDVAHGKPIDKEEYEKAMELIEGYTKIFDQCIEIIDTLKTTQEEAEMVGAMAQQVIQNETMKVEQENDTWIQKLNSFDFSNIVALSKKLNKYAVPKPGVISLDSDFHQAFSTTEMLEKFSDINSLLKGYSKIS